MVNYKVTNLLKKAHIEAYDEPTSPQVETETKKVPSSLVTI